MKILHDFQMHQAVAGNLVAIERLRTAEVVPLEQLEAILAGDPVLFLRLHVLRHQTSLHSLQPAQHLLALGAADFVDFHLDVVSQIGQRSALRFSAETGQGQPEARCLQRAAGRQQALGWLFAG